MSIFTFKALLSPIVSFNLIFSYARTWIQWRRLTSFGVVLFLTWNHFFNLFFLFIILSCLLFELIFQNQVTSNHTKIINTSELLRGHYQIKNNLPGPVTYFLSCSNALVYSSASLCRRYASVSYLAPPW